MEGASGRIEWFSGCVWMRGGVGSWKGEWWVGSVSGGSEWKGRKVSKWWGRLGVMVGEWVSGLVCG